MTPELWQRVKGVLEEARNRNPLERSAFLSHACAGQPELRAEVESLLAQATLTNSFLHSPVMTPRDSLEGAEILHYHIVEKLGEGGMGLVYKARDAHLERLVALKLLTPRLISDPNYSTLARLRFVEEARMCGSLSHPNIANVYDVGEWSKTIYMVQEFVSGHDLHKIIQSPGPLPVRRIIAIIRQICDGLGHAHARGIVHLDIKPANILLDSDDRVKITDFGIAQRQIGRAH